MTTARTQHTAAVTGGQLQQRIIDLCHLFGLAVAHFRPAHTTKGWRTPVASDGKGFPDLVIVGPGGVLYREVKGPSERVTSEQAVWLGRLTTAMLTRPADLLNDLWDGPELDPDPDYVDPIRVERVFTPHAYGCADAWRHITPRERDEVVRLAVCRRYPMTVTSLARLLHLSGGETSALIDRVLHPQPDPMPAGTVPPRPGLPALTIRRPWASLIVDGHKTIENRTWGTPHRGGLLIHAGLRWDGAAARLAATLGVPVGPDRTHPVGVIIGVVDLVGMCDGSDTCRCGPWALPSYRHWQLINPRRFTVPVPWTGRMGLRWTDPTTTRLVEEALHAQP